MANAAGLVAASQAVGGAAGAYGTLQAGRYNSRVDQWNARVSDLQAQDALARGEAAVFRHKQQVEVLKGAQRAALAAQGVVVDDAQGSSGAIIADTNRQAAVDEQQIRSNAALEAWGFQVQSADARAKASMDLARARGDAAGELMSSVGRFADTGSKLGLFDAKKPPAASAPKSSGSSGSTYNPNLPVY